MSQLSPEVQQKASTHTHIHTHTQTHTHNPAACPNLIACVEHREFKSQLCFNTKKNSPESYLSETFLWPFLSRPLQRSDVSFKAHLKLINHGDRKWLIFLPLAKWLIWIERDSAALHKLKVPQLSWFWTKILTSSFLSQRMLGLPQSRKCSSSTRGSHLALQEEVIWAPLKGRSPHLSLANAVRESLATTQNTHTCSHHTRGMHF